MQCPYLTGNTLRLRYEPNRLMLSIGLCRWYHNSGKYPSSCLLFKTQSNTIGLSVPHKKHITYPLRAQQVNAIYRFVTMVY
jgi:hypothetical protein